MNILFPCYPREAWADLGTTWDHEGYHKYSCIAEFQAVSAVENLAALIIRSKLRGSQNVEVNVDSDGLALLQGRLRSASVQGKAWESPARLTAREIQVNNLTEHTCSYHIYVFVLILYEPSHNAIWTPDDPPPLQFCIGDVSINHAALITQRQIIFKNQPQGQGKVQMMQF